MTEKKLSNKPPHSLYIINNLILMGNYIDAQAYCDDNEEFFRSKIGEIHDLYIKAQKCRVEAAGLSFTPPDAYGARPLGELMKEEEARQAGVL